jgi:citrate lyase beta subunit
MEAVNRPAAIHYLYAPADDASSLDRAAASSASGLLVDLEDGVLPDRKAVARAQARTFLTEGRHGGRDVLLRINEIGGPHWQLDLDALAGTARSFLVPKLSSLDELRELETKLEQLERGGAGAVGSHRLAVLVETGAGLIQLREIVGSTARIAAVVFGQADFTVQVGTPGITATGFRPAPALDFANAEIVFIAAAFGLRALVAPWAPRDNAEEQRLEMRRLFAFGYDAMIVSAPAMIEVVEAAYVPSPEEIAFAEGVLAAAEAAKAQGHGVTTYRGWLIEGAYIHMARALLSRRPSP